MSEKRHTLLTTLSLFTSAGTLVCCALPALLVTLGLGAVVAGVVSNVPQLVWLSEHKAWVFGFSAAMLIVAGIAQWRARYLPCPTDPEKAKACGRTRKLSLYIYVFSLSVYLIGFFFAFIAAKVFY